ncbi:MAG: rhodanese-like domain-containing protein, partial [Desulfuromonadales bacterium]
RGSIGGRHHPVEQRHSRGTGMDHRSSGPARCLGGCCRHVESGDRRGSARMVLDERVAEFPKDKQIVLHCNTGVIAEMAYNALKNMGVSNVKFVNARFKFEKDGSYSITKE